MSIMSQEDHARQAALHHFAGRRTEVNAHGVYSCKALEPALAEMVESIEERCVQLEDKADEVTGSLQVRSVMSHLLTKTLCFTQPWRTMLLLANISQV